MRMFLLAFLLSAVCVVAQDNTPATPAPDNTAAPRGQVTFQGCVTRSNGDYILIKQDPGNSYELQASGRLKLHSYLGQQVEITGRKSTSLATSTDSESRSGSPVTITVTSIKTLNRECPAH